MIERDTGPLDNDAALELLRLAGPRTEPLEERRHRVRAAVRSQWQADLALRRRRQWIVAATTLAAAATLVLAVIVPRLGHPPAATEMAQIEVLRGDVGWRQGDRELALAEGAVVFAGTEILTSENGRVALRLADGASLRVDTATTITLEQTGRLRLARGAVYLDSPAESGDSGVVVATPLGQVLEIGTQFEVRVAADELRVRVREGRVRLDRPAGAAEIGAGWELVANASGELSRRPTTPVDSAWAWLLEVAPPYVLEGSSAGDFLRWVSRETGRKLRWAGPELAARADSMVLHGDLAGVRPDQALDLVLPTCGLDHREEGGDLVVSSMTPR